MERARTDVRSQVFLERRPSNVDRWLGQNCWNVSVYVKDAQAQLLPLVGGGEHDWAFLLDHWGWLERDQVVGGAIFLVGVVLYGIAVVSGWKLLPIAAS